MKAVTQAIQMFLSGSKDRFSLFDFSSHTWKKFDDLGNMPEEADAEAELPSISLDLWFEVTAADLYLVIPLLPSTAWHGTQVGVRIEFGAKNAVELLQRFRAARLEAQTKVAALEGGAGAYSSSIYKSADAFRLRFNSLKCKLPKAISTFRRSRSKATNSLYAVEAAPSCRHPW